MSITLKRVDRPLVKNQASTSLSAITSRPRICQILGDQFKPWNYVAAAKSIAGKNEITSLCTNKNAHLFNQTLERIASLEWVNFQKFSNTWSGLEEDAKKRAT